MKATVLAVEVTASHGVPFTVRRVRPGDMYGLGFKLKAESEMVEFYDARFKDKGDWGAFGQFIIRYNDPASLWELKGLCLNGGVDAWRIDRDAMMDALDALNIDGA